MAGSKYSGSQSLFSVNPEQTPPILTIAFLTEAFKRLKLQMGYKDYILNQGTAIPNPPHLNLHQESIGADWSVIQQSSSILHQSNYSFSRRVVYLTQKQFEK